MEGGLGGGVVGLPVHVVTLAQRCVHVQKRLAQVSVYVPMCMCAGCNMCIQCGCVGKGVEDGLV